MKIKSDLNALLANNPIPDLYRQIIHAANLTCTLSCRIGKRSGGMLGITSSNVSPSAFTDAEKEAIIRGDRDLPIARDLGTFLYRLINSTPTARVYRVASHSADFAKGKY